MQLELSALDSLTPLNDTDCLFHHVGFVVDSIDQQAKGFALSMGATWDGKLFQDPLQGVKVIFLSTGSGPTIELVEPCGAKSPAALFAKKGGGLHHICYEVPTLKERLQAARFAGGIVVKPPLPAVAFEGRRIAWVLTPYKLLIEYLERRR